MTGYYQLLGSIVLIGLGGLFAAIDAAISTVSPARVDELVRDQRPGAGSLRKVMADRPRYVNLVVLLRTSCEITATALLVVFIRYHFSMVWGLYLAAGIMVLASFKSLPVFTFGEETGMTEFHSGFVCLVGRPNTGKSTLTNALVGAKVAITSTRPQTTRHAIRGIVHSDDFQIILVDTPGLHRPRTLLGKRLNDLVRETYAAVDVIGLCIPADEAIGPGDRWIVEQLRSTGPANTTLVVIVTKIDKVPKEKVVAQLVAVSELVTNAAEIVPVSAMTGDRVDLLIDVLAAALPAGPAYYPDGELTDEPEEVLMAELIREAALQGVRDELPHSLAVVIDEVSPREGRDDLIDVHAALYVERDSQKGIVIGKGGARLREVGTAARSQIENLLGTKVYLDLRVKVAKNWQRDPKQLGRLGF